MLYRENLKRKLAPIRYEHSLSVSYTCMSLTIHCGCNPDKTKLAGPLCNCGKQYSDDIVLKKYLKHGLEVTDAECKALPVLHAKYGAWLAKHKYQITGREILDAIGCHIAGKSEMITLNKIPYTADCIEPRHYRVENLPEIRRLTYEDLDGTVYTILAGTLDYLKKKGENVDPLIAQAYEYFKIGSCRTNSRP